MKNVNLKIAVLKKGVEWLLKSYKTNLQIIHIYLLFIFEFELGNLAGPKNITDFVKDLLTLLGYSS